MEPPASFDDQAASYDERAGLFPDTRREVAGAVCEIGAVRRGDVVLDIGTGTGSLLFELAASGALVVGLDLSLDMLRQASRMPRGHPPPARIRADAGRGWPVRSRTVRAAFGSRSLHLLDARHVAAQWGRVAGPDGSVILAGRVDREPTSVRQTMRRAMRRCLREHGIAGRDAERHRERLVEACIEQGAERIAPLVVSSWTVRSAPRDSLRGWEAVGGLAGVRLPRSTKEAVLAQVETIARETFGDLDEPRASRERYLLEGARLRARGGGPKDR